MRERIQERSNRLGKTWPELLGELQGQGEFFEKLAQEKRVPRELLRKPHQEQVPEQITTARGSLYRYLPDGRTQRFKTVENDLRPPRDILVFIPPWDLIAEKAQKLYPEILGAFDDEETFVDYLLNCVHNSGSTVRVIDGKGKSLETNAEVAAAEQAYLYFADAADSKQVFNVPVGRRPVVGWTTFDTGKQQDADGKWRRHLHIGNKIVSIKWRSSH